MSPRRSFIDSFKHQGWRRQMVKDLNQKKGIDNPAVLEAIGSVPRHLFIDTVLEYRAYEDCALPILCGQTISQPSTVAFQSQLLDAQPGMKVLEIGTGSGYQTAVLCAMGLKVFTIERQKELFDHTKELLAWLRYPAKCFLGDGYKGLQEVNYGPYDRVIITCGASQMPVEVLRQLKVGGIMVIPLGGEHQTMLKVVKTGAGDSDYESTSYGDCKFVPMLGKINFGN